MGGDAVISSCWPKGGAKYRIDKGTPSYNPKQGVAYDCNSE